MSFAHTHSAHTPSQLRRQVHPSLDTPTPAPSSGHSSVVITSLKPVRSRSNLSGDLPDARQRASLKPFQTSLPTLHHSLHTSHQPPVSRPLGPSLGRQLNISELNTEDLNLDHLEIATDGTERQRLTLEAEIRKGMGELQSRSSNASSSDRNSIGFGDLSDAEDMRRTGRGGMGAGMYDESESSSESLGDDFSLRIGMAGRKSSYELAPGPGRAPPSEDASHHESSSSQSEDDLDADLSYQTQRTEEPRPAPPPHQNNNAPAPPPAAAPLPSSSAFGFARSQFATKPFPRPAASAPLPPSAPVNRANAAVFSDENRPPNAGPPLSAHRPTFANLHSTTVPPKSYTSSPVPLRAPNNTRQPAAPPKTFGMQEASARMRLPDVTGLTEGLQSPVRARGHYGVPPNAPNPEDAAVVGMLDQLKRKLSSLERENAISAARVRELENRLEKDERDASVRGAFPPPAAHQDAREDWEEKLRQEQEQRLGIESLVERLRSQVTHLGHSLQSQAESIADLRSHRHGPSAHQQELEAEVASLRTGLDGLGAEVDAVKTVVDELVREREAHAIAAWEREEDERRRSMERGSEVEMNGLGRKGVDRVRREMAPTLTQEREPPAGRPGRENRGQQGVEDPDRTPRAARTINNCKWTGPDTPRTGRSLHSPEEIEELRRSMAEEAVRTSSPRPQQSRPTQFYEAEKPAQSRRPQFAAAPFASTRPATAPLPTKQPTPPLPPRSYASYESHLSPPPSTHRRPSRPTKDAESVADANAFDARANRVFHSVRNVNAYAELCSVCRKRRKSGAPTSAPPKMQRGEWDYDDEEYEADEEAPKPKPKPKPAQQQQQQQRSKKDLQATVDRALRVLEEDFGAHKRIYVELATEYRGMDSKVDGGKRKILADHLKESIDTLELKAEQIRDMHDLFHPAVVASHQYPSRQFGAPRMREGIV